MKNNKQPLKWKDRSHRFLFLALFFFSTFILQAQVNVRGKVVDATGETLIGVNVIVKGTTQGTITDTNGEFNLSVPSSNSTLIFSYVGFVEQEIPLNGRTYLNVTMEQDTELLEEVIVVGYGTQKKVNLTGSVSQVSGEILSDRAIVNVGQGLQGAIANLNVTANPGDPGTIGQGASFNIRGLTSINGGSPLILIDGVPADINSINPNDIENISVLKDAASAAIYGARASYGVVLITTKKGSIGKLVVSYKGSISSNFQTNIPKTVNSLEYARVMNEASANSGSSPMFSEEHIQRIKNYMDDPKNTPSTIPDPGNPNMWSYALGNDNVNWFDIYYKNGDLSYKHDLSVSGGVGETDYRLSVGYLGQEGILKIGNDHYDRLNFLSNIRTSPTEWLRFDVSTLFSQSNWDEPYPYSGSMGNWFHTAYTRQPHWPLYDPNGHPMWTSQIQYFEGARQLRTTEDLWIKGGVEIEPIKDWKVNARYSWNKVSNMNKAHEAKLYAHDVKGNPYPIYPNNSAEETNNDSDYRMIELYTSYNKDINNHFVNFLLGSQLEEYNYFGVGANVRDLISDELPAINTGTGLLQAWDSKGHWATLGFFGRVNYSYKEKYLFEVNTRYDGTSKFPSKQRWGLFPSFSAGWNIANEDFFRSDDIDMLKIRASYGELGNQQVQNYMFYNVMPINRNLGYLIAGERPNFLGTPGLVSSDLTWEVTRTKNLGIDFMALNNRLDFSFDWYIRETLDMISVSEVLPATLGASAPLTNNADLETKGWEFSLSWKDMVGDDFYYNLSFNLSDNITKITRYNNPNYLIDDYYKGKVIGEIWGYKTHGLIQTQEQLDNMADQTTYINALPWKLGDVEYMDLNGDKIISPGDRTLQNPGDLTVIGNSTPRYQFGLNVEAGWKGIDLRLFFQGTMKRDVWLSDIPFFGITGSWTQVVFEETLDYWSEDNTDAYFAKPYITSETLKNQQVSDRYLQNAAYVRLKNIQLGFSIPEFFLNKKQIEKLRIYVNGENLFYISPIDKRFDPERIHGSWGPGKTYPILGTITAGISIDF